jgi:hypothetical protein
VCNREGRGSTNGSSRIVWRGSWIVQWEQQDSMERELDSFKKLEELQMMEMMREM